MNIIRRNWPENSDCSPRLSVICTYVRCIFCIWTVWQWLCVPAACRVSHCWCSDYLNIYCPSWSSTLVRRTEDRSGSVSVTVWTDDDVFPLLLCCVSKTIQTLWVSLLSDRRFHTWTLFDVSVIWSHICCSELRRSFCSVCLWNTGSVSWQWDQWRHIRCADIMSKNYETQQLLSVRDQWVIYYICIYILLYIYLYITVIYIWVM